MTEVCQINLNARYQPVVIRDVYFRRIRRCDAGGRNRDCILIFTGNGIGYLDVINPPTAIRFPYYIVRSSQPTELDVLIVSNGWKINFGGNV